MKIKTIDNMSPHIIHQPLVDLEQYWFVKKIYYDRNNSLIGGQVHNGLIYIIPIELLMEFIESSHQYKRKSCKYDDCNDWAVRIIRSKHLWDHGFFRVYYRKLSCYWDFESEFLLISGEPAYQCFCGKTGREKNFKKLVTFLSDNRTKIKIKISPRYIKKAAFFCVNRIYLYKKKGAIHFFTNSGDRYAIPIRDNQHATWILQNIEMRSYTRFRTEEGIHFETLGDGGRFLFANQLEPHIKDEVDRIALEIAFQQDYRFKGHYGDYIANQTWYIYPAEVIFKKDYVWPWEYAW